MLTLIFSLVFSAQVQAAPVDAACETLAPNLDGIAVTICDGRVVSRTDSLGVTHYSFNDSIDRF